MYGCVGVCDVTREVTRTLRMFSAALVKFHCHRNLSEKSPERRDTQEGVVGAGFSLLLRVRGGKHMDYHSRKELLKERFSVFGTGTVWNWGICAFFSWS